MEQQHGIFTPFSREELIPKEERIDVAKKNGKFSIGIPKETHLQEKRICLSPDAVQVLVSNGHSITLESGAGEDSHYSDQQYSEAGAEISYDTKAVFEKPIILKVGALTQEEIEYIKPYTVIVSTVQLNIQTKEYFEKLAKKRVTAIAFEFLKDKHGNLPVVRLLSEIAGTASILIASDLMSNHNGGNGILLGGIAGVRPTEVVIIGAGTVGEYACRSAIGLGASVRVFDNSLTRLRRLQDNVGVRISTSTIDPKELKKSLMRCDLAIGALRGKGRTPCVVSESMVEKMKPGAVIIDVSIDNGGCFETSEITTHQNPVIIKHNVLHYGVTNITSKFSRTSTKALSNFFLPYILSIGKEGGFENLLLHDPGAREGVYLYKGRLCKQNIAQWFDLPFSDINLLIV